MHQVFISYASEDARVANEICARLESGGVLCWIAPRNISPGSDYATAIVRAIEMCSTLLLVYTDKANDSPFVLKEVERAVSKRKSVLTVRLTSAEPSPGLELFIASTQWLDAEKEPLEQSLARLSAVLSKQAAAKADGTSTPSHTMSDYYMPLPAAKKKSINIPPAVGYGGAGILGAGIIGLVLWLAGAFGSGTTTGPTTDTAGITPPVTVAGDMPPTTAGETPPVETPTTSPANNGSKDGNVNVVNTTGDTTAPVSVPVTVADQAAENTILGTWSGASYDIYGEASQLTLTLKEDGSFEQRSVSTSGFSLRIWGKWQSSESMIVLDFAGWDPQENCRRPAGCGMVQLGKGDDIAYALEGDVLKTALGDLSRSR